MDKRLEEAFDLVKHQQIQRNQRDLLDEWLDERLQISRAGGVFKINSNLLNLIKLFVENGRESAVLFDSYNQPAMIDNLPQFLEDVLDIYFNITTEYFAKYQQIRREKSVKGLVGCLEES